MSLPPLTLPPELWDGVLDHLHNDFASLRSTALVCHTWVPTSRFHLFAAITLSDKCPARAASLNSLLANPHATIPPAVQALVLHGAHTLVQLRGIQVPSPAITDFTTLLSLAPRLIHFRYLREQSLSDVPRTFLSAVPTVERVTLTGTCIGVGLLWVVRDLPRLTHLTLENVSALPCRRGRSAEIQSSVHTVIIRSSSFLCASLIVLGWLGCAAPNVAILSVDMFYARELQYLAEYLSVISSTLRELELSISGADIDVLALPEFLAPCTTLEILRLKFSAPAHVRHFFALGAGRNGPWPPTMRLLIVIRKAERVEHESLVEFFRDWTINVQVVCS